MKPYWELDWDLPTVLVLGNEGSGVHASIEACCTDFVTLQRQRVKMVKGIQKKS